MALLFPIISDRLHRLQLPLLETCSTLFGAGGSFPYPRGPTLTCAEKTKAVLRQAGAASLVGSLSATHPSLGRSRSYQAGSRS